MTERDQEHPPSPLQQQEAYKPQGHGLVFVSKSRDEQHNHSDFVLHIMCLRVTVCAFPSSVTLMGRSQSAIGTVHVSAMLDTGW